MREYVEDRPNLVKVDRAYVINTDDDAYQAALIRRKNATLAKLQEGRIQMLEQKIEALMSAFINRSTT